MNDWYCQFDCRNTVDVLRLDNVVAVMNHSFDDGLEQVLSLLLFSFFACVVSQFKLFLPPIQMRIDEGFYFDSSFLLFLLLLYLLSSRSAALSRL